MDKKSWSPKELKGELKKKIIGQEEYLKDLSTCLWLHHKRRQHFLKTGEKVKKPKYNMFIIGKSGMGKTSAISEAAKLLDIPIVIEDASEFRGSGWKGRQVCEIVRDIATATGLHNKNQTNPDEFAIVVLDEMDKVFGQTGDKTFSPVFNLLKFIEGMDASFVEGNSHIQMNTDNLLFIVAGAFDGLEEQILRRMKPKNIGFSSDSQNGQMADENILKNVTTDDLVSFGVNEQFLGRFPLICVLNELDTGAYRKILLESEISPIKQLDYLFQKEYGVRISITKQAADKLAEFVKKSPLGARGLQQKVAFLFKDTLYHLHDDIKCEKYLLDYDSGFIVKPVSGTRKVFLKQKRNAPFVLTKNEKKRIRYVELDDICENEADIRVYAEDIFETFETGKFGETKEEGLVDIYDYMTIKQAKYFTAAAICSLFLEVKRSCWNGSDRSKNMVSLLEVIHELKIDYHKTTTHPLEQLEKRLLCRLKGCKKEQIEQIREIAWEVVRKYAFIIADLQRQAQKIYDNSMAAK